MSNPEFHTDIIKAPKHKEAKEKSLAKKMSSSRIIPNRQLSIGLNLAKVIKELEPKNSDLRNASEEFLNEIYDVPYTKQINKIKLLANFALDESTVGSTTHNLAEQVIDILAEKKDKLGINFDKPRSNTPEQVAKWAKRKYGKDALYMLEETGEGREVFGEDLTEKAIKIIKSQKESTIPKSLLKSINNAIEDYEGGNDLTYQYEQLRNSIKKDKKLSIDIKKKAIKLLDEKYKKEDSDRY